MIEIVKVKKVRSLGGYRLAVEFANGDAGEIDLSDMIAEGGPMIEPLRDPTIFAKVAVSFGVPSWPNGFDIDAIKLHQDMKAMGALKRPVGV
jgi:hypothetical protein